MYFWNNSVHPAQSLEFSMMSSALPWNGDTKGLCNGTCRRTKLHLQSKEKSEFEERINEENKRTSSIRPISRNLPEGRSSNDWSRENFQVSMRKRRWKLRDGRWFHWTLNVDFHQMEDKYHDSGWTKSHDPLSIELNINHRIQEDNVLREGKRIKWTLEPSSGVG